MLFNMTSINRSTLVAIVASITQLSFVSGQICSCSPTVYRWTLDFASSCNFGPGIEQPSIGIDIGQDLGVTAAICKVSVVNPTNDLDALVPVMVTGFQFIELDNNLETIKIESSSGGPDFIPLQDGDVLQYTSETASGTEIPAAMAAFVFAENSQGTALQLEWFIDFSNLCETIPFQNDDSLGWLVFDDSTPARDSTCRLPSPFPSIQQTPLPTSLPTSIPSKQPTAMPSILPIVSPSIDPSARPSTSPSMISTISPSISQSRSPSEQPIALPSDRPSPSPSTTSKPSRSPTPTVVSPSESPTLAPNSDNTPAPTPYKNLKSLKNKGSKSTKSLKNKGSKSSKSLKNKASKSSKSLKNKASKSSWSYKSKGSKSLKNKLSKSSWSYKNKGSKSSKNKASKSSWSYKSKGSKSLESKSSKSQTSDESNVNPVGR